MTESEAVRLTRKFIEKQFPRTCTKCGRTFRTLGEYLRNTTHVGPPVSYDAEAGSWLPRRPFGTFSMANCKCGTTITITTRGMSLFLLWKLMRWARKETRKRGITMRQLLAEIREKIDGQVLSENGA